MKNLSERALGIRFRGSGGLWDTEERPGEPQGGLQELQSHDPSSLPSDSELPRSYEAHRPSFDPPSGGVIFAVDVVP